MKKILVRIFGSLFLITSIFLFLSSINSLIYWMRVYGFIEWGEPFVMGIAFGLVLFPTGLVYSFLPEQKFNIFLKISVIINFSIIMVNISLLGLVLLCSFLGIDALWFALIFIFLLAPMSIIGFIISLICVLIAPFRKSITTFA